MSDKISSDIVTLDPGAIVHLFEMDLSTGSASSSIDILRWHSGSNEQLQEIVWQGNIYAPFPVQAEGFEFSGVGAIPRPSLTIANITSALTSLISNYDDLVGAKVTRKRTFVKYLDEYCYVGGAALAGTCSAESGGSPYSQSKADCLDSNKNGSAGTWTDYTSTSCNSAGGTWYANSIADDTAHFVNEVWYVDRKVLETRTHIQFELTAAHDVQGIQLPGRSIIANTCVWAYKGSECGYTGTNYWDISNNSVISSADDVCAKTFTACELRFPEPAETPYGGFPGAGINMGTVR